MPHWKFSRTSLHRLEGVHPDLVKIVHHALMVSPVDFGITCGRRSDEEQKRLLAQGKSKKRKSKHLLDPAEAVDVVAWKDGKINWDDLDLYCKIADAFGVAAEDACDYPIEIRWGGGWGAVGFRPAKEIHRDYVAWAAKKGRRPFVDAVHFEIAG